MFRTQFTQKSPLFTSLYASLFTLILLILGQNGFNFWLAYLRGQLFDTVTHNLLVQREGKQLLNVAIDVVIDRKKNSIKAHKAERLVFDSSLNRLYQLLKDNPSQLKQLDRIKYLYNQWQNELNQAKAARFTSSYSKENTALFDSLHAQINSLILREEQLLDERRNQLRDLSYVNIFTNIFSTLATLLLVGLNVWLLHRRAKLPLRNLIEASKLWRQGKMEIQVGYSSRDEVGELTEVLDAMTSEIHQTQTLIKERNQHLEDLICALSHDLRTPLLATRTTLDSMLRGAFGPVNDTWREVFEEYQQANADLLKLVETLVDVSRYETGCGIQLNYEPLNWEEIFVKVIAQIDRASKPELIFICKISRSLPIVYGDRLQIQRVLQNLLENAVRVSEPRKEIVLEVAPFKEAQVRVFVRDRGPGIAPQNKEQLFYRFTQGRNHRGKSGLGLYLCRQIVETHAGSIGVESSLGEGSAFWFTLPANTDEATLQHQN